MSPWPSLCSWVYPAKESVCVFHGPDVGHRRDAARAGLQWGGNLRRMRLEMACLPGAKGGAFSYLPEESICLMELAGRPRKGKDQLAILATSTEPHCNMSHQSPASRCSYLRLPPSLPACPLQLCGSLRPPQGGKRSRNLKWGAGAASSRSLVPAAGAPRASKPGRQELSL